MSTIKQFIDNQILNPSPQSSGLYKKIADKITMCKKAIDNGSLSIPGQSGIDKLVATRVLALYKVSTEESIAVTNTSDSKKTDRKKVFAPVREEAFHFDGFVSWGGNDAFICPWLTEFVSPESSENSSNPFNPSQSYQYTEFCKDVKFNTSSVLTSQNKQIVLDFNSIMYFNKAEKNIYIGYPNDNSSFSDATKAKFVIGLSQHITDQYWCIGKIKTYKSNYVVIQVISFKSENDLNLFERPNCCPTSKDGGKCYTANSYLLFININDGSVSKLSNNTSIEQTKVDIIAGYTDFIIHDNKIFSIKTNGTTNVEFKGFMLGTKPKTSGYVKLNKPLKYNLVSCKLELHEILIGQVVTTKKLKDISVPAELMKNRFGITGSVKCVTTAKLAANDINPYCFYVQIFYELIAQLPYDYDKDFYGNPYWENGLGKILRTNPDKFELFCYDEEEAEKLDYLYGSTLVSPADNILYGAVVKIAGHMYAEIPFEYSDTTLLYTDKSSSSLDIIYETVDEAKPSYSPLNTDWEVWPYGKGNISAGDVFVIWHMASLSLGSGSSYSQEITNVLQAKIEEGSHPVAVSIDKKIQAKETITTYAKSVGAGYKTDKKKWSKGIALARGAYSFPFERRYAYTGGNRGSFSHPVSGYNSCQDTFLVTYTHDDVPINGNRSIEKARPVLLLGGMGMMPDPFKYMGVWGEQLTQSPLLVEVWAYDTVAGNMLSSFSHCNADTQPKVFMQGHEIPLGTIGYYSTTYDASSPDNQVLHGMYPLAQNGISIDENEHKIETYAHIFNDMKPMQNDPFTIYYILFMYKEEKDTTAGVYKIKNHILESRAYRIVPFKDSSYNGFSQMRLDAAKAMAYWWSKYAPAKPTDPVPWFGPSQLDLHINVQ